MIKIIVFIVATLCSACTCKEVEAPTIATEETVTTETETTEMETIRESERYVIKNCRYFVNEMPSLQTEPFSIICPNGEAFIYETDMISDVPVYDGMPVWAGFDDNGTPNDIKDDIVLGLVFDREIAIYDELYDSFSENEDWIVTRPRNNHIHIDVNKE